jgi:hypothetical protein
MRNTSRPGVLRRERGRISDPENSYSALINSDNAVANFYEWIQRSGNAYQ